MTLRHLGLAAVLAAILVVACVWTARSPEQIRRNPPPPATGQTQDEALLGCWAAALRAQDGIATARAEADLVRGGDAVVASLTRVADESPDLAHDVARVLGRIRSTASVSALERLHRELGAKGGPSLRAAVLRAVAEIGGQSARDAFLALLRDETDDDVRRIAVEVATALLRPEDMASLPPDLRTRVQGDTAHREDVAKLLMEMSKTTASSRSSAEWAMYLSPLCPLAGRLIAVERLEARGDDEALDALREAAAGDDLDTAVAAFGALCRLRSHPVRMAVKGIVLSAPEDRLAALLDVLGTYGDAAYVPLARQLRDRSGSEHLKDLADRAALRLELR